MSHQDIAGQAFALVDTATVVVDASTASVFVLSAAAGRTIANPTNVKAGLVYVFIIQNSSGGPMTTTWSANFKLAGAWVDPANTKRRSIMFAATDANTLIEVARAGADI